MKFIALLFSFIVLYTIPAHAGYFVVGGGAGGDADAGNVSIEIGGVNRDNSVGILFGLGMDFISNADDVPSGTLAYPVPHTNFRTIGWRQKGNELGMYGKIGIEPVKDSGFFINALGGYSSAEEVELAQSNVTGWYYENSTRDEGHGMYGGGLAYVPTSNGFAVHVDYDNRRGVTGQIGWRW